MNKADQQPLTSQPISQTPNSNTPANPNSAPNSITNRKGFVPIIIGVILLILIVGGGAYYLGKQSSTNSQLQNQKQSQSNINPPLTTSQPSPTDLLSEPTVTLSPGWAYKNNGECAVKFAIPPKQTPYYQVPDPNRQSSVANDEGSGRFWDFPRGSSYPNLLVKLPNGYESHKQAPTMYASAEEASGYISQGVIVSCIPNTANLSNQSMLNSLKTKLIDFNQSTGEKGMEADTYTITSSEEVNRWGKTVLDLTVSEYFKNLGSQPVTNTIRYTMFATPQFIYEVRIIGASENIFVKETAKKIFDNLQFDSN